jgi:hypothetical protein
MRTTKQDKLCIAAAIVLTVVAIMAISAGLI